MSIKSEGKDSEMAKNLFKLILEDRLMWVNF